MVRRTFVVLFVACIFIVIAGIVLSVRSKSTYERFGVGYAPTVEGWEQWLARTGHSAWCRAGFCGAVSFDGVLRFEKGSSLELCKSPRARWWFVHDDQFLPIGDVGGDHWRRITIPDWTIILSSAVMGVLFWNCGRIAKGRRWRRAGLCIRCGYDLRFTPARCPECGTLTNSSPLPSHAVAEKRE
jgi:hypothetical protein